MKQIILIILYFILVGSHEKLDQFKVTRSHPDICINKIYEYPINPLKEIIVTSRFGPRKHPITKKWKFHKGLDLDGIRGDTIFSSLIRGKLFWGVMMGISRTKA